jgi:hypothetical protein
VKWACSARNCRSLWRPGGGLRDQRLLLEQIAYGDFNVSYVNLLTSLCGQIVASHARPEIAGSGWIR